MTQLSVSDLLKQLTQATKSSEKIATLTALPYVFENFKSLADGITSLDRSDLQSCIDALEFYKTVLSSGEPKESRIAGWAIGRLIRLAHSTLRSGSQLKSKTDSKEPMNYHRLSEDESYLRVCFDYLTDKLAVSSPQHMFILRSICSMNIEFPAVNWITFFSKVLQSPDIYKDIASEIISFVCLQSKGAKSAQTILLELFKLEVFATHEALVTSGISRILELAGMQKQEGDVRRLPDIALSKVIEILNLLVYGSLKAQKYLDLRVALYTTLAEYLQYEQASGPTTRLREKLLSFAASYLKSLRHSLMPSEYSLARLLVSITVTNEDIFNGIWTELVDEVKSNVVWSKSHIAIVCTLAELSVTDLSGKPKILPKLSKAFVSLFGSPENALSRMLGQHLSRASSLSTFSVDVFLLFMKTLPKDVFLKDVGAWIIRLLDICIVLNDECDLGSWLALVSGFHRVLWLDSENGKEWGRDDLEHLCLEFCIAFPAMVAAMSEESREKIYRRLLSVDGIIRDRETSSMPLSRHKTFIATLLVSFPFNTERRRLWPTVALHSF
ncbi:hypothetical protein BC829DRAFT_108317 [Chytridium lagenaria]|nr:hypothetical protein BC829DRAFT_108317 [Chytridium lagenaria]